MGLEAGTTIASLNSTWPTASDARSQGDNHFRLIKAVLKAQFPGVGGSGFSIPITATEAEINYLSGVTSNIQAQLNAITASTALIAPSGTVMLFFQAAPPAGWTQLAANNDSMLRVVSTAGGGVGGSVSPISFNWAHTHTTGDHALTIAEMPAHDHAMSQASVDSSGGANRATNWTGSGPMLTGSTGGGGVHNHGATGSSGSTWTPKYINVITATKT